MEDYIDEVEPTFYTVTIAMVHRLYGGPEEGGWYYDQYTPLTNKPNAPFIRTFTDYHDAVKYANELYCDVVEDLNVGRAPLYSVRSDGIYAAHIWDGFPSQTPRPTYE